MGPRLQPFFVNEYSTCGGTVLSTLRDTIALLELRIGLETEAAALAATRRTDENLSKMQLALTAFKTFDEIDRTDIVYVPLITPLLADARARGLRIVDGLGMLLHQAVPGFEAWFGVRPDVTVELRDKVAATL